ncbi:MAG: TRAM domain-containing protein, partial [Veillonella sp.]|nr:TRAM domain-containing protein [Veillonella sp.]
IVEGPSRKDEHMWFGRTEGNKMILFPEDPDLSIGDTVEIKVDRAQTWVCYGTIIK